MKIGVISDTHIPIAAKELPAKIEKYFTGADLILHAGDLINIDVLEQLKKYCPNVEAVCGNMDESKVQTTLKKKQIIEAGSCKIGLIHGWGAPAAIPEVVRNEFNDVDVIVFGHSHAPFNKKQNGVLFFNPGSPTDTVYAKFNSIGILEINNKKVKGTIIKL